jgi:hypothetical protein
MHRYDDPDKRQNCETIWATLSSRIADGPALMLPGSRPHEFHTAIRYGYKPENIYLVEDGSDKPDPQTPDALSARATKANFTRRVAKKHIPHLQWQMGRLSDVCKILVKMGVSLAAAHLDFCKPLGFFNTNSPAVEIEKFIKSCVMEDGLLAITVLGAREQDGTDNDAERYRRMERAVNLRLNFGTPRTATLIQVGRYWNYSTNNPMIWGIFKIERKKL